MRSEIRRALTALLVPNFFLHNIRSTARDNLVHFRRPIFSLVNFHSSIFTRHTTAVTASARSTCLHLHFTEAQVAFCFQSLEPISRAGSTYRGGPTADRRQSLSGFQSRRFGFGARRCDGRHREHPISVVHEPNRDPDPAFKKKSAEVSVHMHDDDRAGLEAGKGGCRSKEPRAGLAATHMVFMRKR